MVRRIIEEIGGSVVARNTAGHQGFAVELTWPREPRVRADVPRPIATAATSVVAVDAPRPNMDDLIRRPRVRTLE